MLLLLFAGGDVEIAVPLTTLTVSQPTPTISAGKAVNVPLSSLVISAPLPTLAVGKSVTVPLTSLVFSTFTPVVGTDVTILVPLTSFVVAAPVPRLRVGDVTYAEIRVIQDLFDVYEYVLGYELAGGIEFLPDTFLRDDNSVEGAELEEMPEPTGPATLSEINSYVYTSAG